MLKSVIDHLVVTAPSREVGSDHITEVLGIVPQRGGEHLQMGTHNALVRLGDEVYLEVIAVNPSVSAPPRARWFGLDDLAATPRPRLATWVVRTNDIQSAATRAPVPLGPIETMTRGSLTWRITIPSDGNMPLNGAAPSLIQWSGADHPAAALADVGCTLEELEIYHPQANLLDELLREIGFDGPLALSLAGRPRLTAKIGTPRGPRVLGEP